MKKTVFCVFIVFIFILTSCTNKHSATIKKGNVNFNADLSLNVYGNDIKGEVEKINNEELIFTVKQPAFAKGMTISVNLKDDERYALCFNGMTVDFTKKTTKVIDTLIFILKVYNGSEQNNSILIDKQKNSIRLDIKDLGVKVKIDNIQYV